MAVAVFGFRNRPAKKMACQGDRQARVGTSGSLCFDALVYNYTLIYNPVNNWNEGFMHALKTGNLPCRLMASPLHYAEFNRHLDIEQ